VSRQGTETGTQIESAKIDTDPPLHPDTKKCAYCGSRMDLYASLCPTCKSYQSVLRNWIVFAGGSVGLFTLVLSGAAFFAKTISPLLYWSDQIHVHYFHSYNNGEYSLSLSNSSSGDVLVSEVTVYMGSTENFPFRVNAVLHPGEILTRLVKDEGTQYASLTGYFANIDGTPSAYILKNSSVEWNTRDRCYAIFFINSDAEDIVRMNQAYAVLGRKLATYPAYAKVVYFDGWTGRRFDQEFPAVATFLRSIDPRCTGSGE